jgi:hypothetical protein
MTRAMSFVTDYCNLEIRAFVPRFRLLWSPSTRYPRGESRRNWSYLGKEILE